MTTPLIQRIRKLLELARHHATPEDEALAAHAKARDLMIQYEVDPDAVEERDSSGDYVAALVPIEGMMWKAQLAQSAASMYFCEAFLDNWPMPAVTAMFVFGAKRHVDIAVSFADYLIGAVDRKLVKAREVDSTLTGAAAFATSFCDAAAIRLTRRIQTIIEDRKKTIPVAGSGLPVPLDLATKARVAFEAMGGKDVERVAGKVSTDDALGSVLGSVAGGEIGLDPQLAGGGPVAGALPGQG